MRTACLSELATAGGLVGGPFGSSLVNSDYAQSGIPVIRGTNMGTPNIVGEFVYVSKEKTARDLARNVASPGDLIFTQRGTLGQVSLVPHGEYPRYVVSQSQMRLRVHTEKAVPRFVYYACTDPAFLRQIDDRAVQTGVPHINLGTLGELSIPFPPLPEQRAIAEVLGALDDKIAANAKLVTSEERIAILQSQRHEPAVVLADIAELDRTSVSPASYGKRVIAHFSLPAFDDSRLPEHEEASAILSGKFSLQTPCVLLSKLNPRFPRIWNVPQLPALPAFASTEFLPLVPKGTSASVLWALISVPSVTDYLRERVSGTSGSHQRVKPGDVASAPVADPATLSDSEQELFEAVGQHILGLRKQSRTLATLRDTLLPALMSGRLRVRDAIATAEEVL